MATTSFTFAKGEIKNLIPLFNKLYSLKANSVNGLTRYELYDNLYGRIQRDYLKLTMKGAILTAAQFASSYLRAEIDIVIGMIAAKQSLQTGESIALRVRTSNSTGKETFVVADVLPILAGNEKMVKSLAKKMTADNKLFAIRTNNGEKGVSLTVYRVVVRRTAKVDENNQPVVDKKGQPVFVNQKIATIESKAIQRYSNTESAFKKGVVKGLNQAI